jgi:hypothetical protein
MIIATGLTLAYRGLLFAHLRLGWSAIDKETIQFMEGFDPAVFGVLISCVAFLLLSAHSRLRHGEA